jgi:hypothetical protein
MRAIKTFFLRLYLDTDAPTRLCGDLQTQPDRKIIPFQNEEGLVKLLRQMSAAAAGTGPAPDLTASEPIQKQS